MRRILFYLKKLISDTLAPKGRFELKRVASFSAFVVAVVYGFMNGYHLEVFVGFISFSATAIGINVWEGRGKS